MRVRDRLEATVHAELPEDVLDVVPDRRLADVQPLGGGRGVQSEAHEAQQLELAPREHTADRGFPTGVRACQPLVDEREQLFRGGDIAKQVDDQRARLAVAASPRGC